MTDTLEGCFDHNMTTLCEVNTCPAETPMERLVVVCSGRKPKADNLVCRFNNGATVPAQLDAETNQISCRPPEVCHVLACLQS